MESLLYALTDALLLSEKHQLMHSIVYSTISKERTADDDKSASFLLPNEQDEINYKTEREMVGDRILTAVFSTVARTV